MPSPPATPSLSVHRGAADRPPGAAGPRQPGEGHPGTCARAAGWALGLALLGVIAALALGMDRGVVLSNDVKAWCWPWGGQRQRVEPQAPVLSDPVWQFVPWIEVARRQLAAGELPLWNPHQDGGVPLLGNPMSALLSPLTWPALVLGVAPGWNVSLLLRLLLAAAATFIWLRGEGRSHLGAALGASMIALSGPFIAWLENPNALALAPYPLVLYFGRRLVSSRSRGSSAGLAVSTALVILGGHPETAFFAALLAGAALAARATSAARFGRAVLAALCGALLAAPMLLPFLEYLSLSRAGAGLDRAHFVLPDSALVRFLLPHAQAGNPITAAATVSLLGLVLASVGAAGARRHRGRIVWVVAVAVIVLVCYDNPLARALAEHTAIFWTRALIILPVPLAALASAGLDDLRTAVTLRRGSVVSAAVSALAVVVATAELASAARGVHAVTPASEIHPTTPLLARVMSDRDIFRILPLHTFLPANSAGQYGLDDLRGYDAITPRAWRTTRQAIGRFGSAPSVSDIVEPWDLTRGGEALDAWNVKYLMVHPQLGWDAAAFARLGLDLEEIYRGSDGVLLRNRRVLPRARLEGGGTVTVTSRSATRWRLRVDAAGPDTLILANPYFPGWRILLDGRRSRRSQAVGKAIRLSVPPGRHEVEVVYRPLSFLAGLVVALVGAVAVALTLRPRRPARAGLSPATPPPG